MKIMRVGVIGSGQMGSGIAQAAATGGLRVVLRDVSEAICTGAMERMRKGLEGRVAKGKLTQEEAEAILANIETTTRLTDLADCDMVIEAAPEELALKQSVFEDLGQICRPGAILCTNTSSLSIGDITARCSHPERCCGMHFFFPVAVMKLVEIIRSAATADETVETVRAVSARLGKMPVVCRTDTPGFIVNRCLFAMLLEAIHCYEDGVATTEDIDTAMKLGLNHPMGPFEMMDLSGLDTFPHVCESLSHLDVTGWETPNAVRELVEAGRLGRKSGRGWYAYGERP